MAAKKNIKNNNAVRITQPRSGRLLKGKAWTEKYDGKNMVRGYAKHFRVDLLCAIKELRLLGIQVTEQYEQAVKQTLEARARQRQLHKERKSPTSADAMGDSDDNFAFIIGYTSGGAPYGVRWEDMPDEEDPS